MQIHPLIHPIQLLSVQQMIYYVVKGFTDISIESKHLADISFHDFTTGAVWLGEGVQNNLGIASLA